MKLAIILLSAYIVDRIAGDPRKLPHPVIYMGKAISALERGIRRFAATPNALKRAGILLPLLVAGGAWALTALVVMLLYRLSPWLAGAAEVWLISTTIASKGLKDAGMAVYAELRSGICPLPAGRSG